MSTKCSIAVAGSVLAAIIAAGDVLAQGGVPEIIAGRNGEAEVIFKNNCVVYYNARGRRTDSLPACRDRQISRADDAIAAYRREQGLDGGSSGHGADRDRPPEIIAGRNGEAEVVFANNCVVYYNARGRRTDSQRACRDRQIQQADQAMAAYRREQGLDGSSGDHGGGGYRGPEIIFGNAGHSRVEFGNKCIITYDDNGNRVKIYPACQAHEVQQADQAIKDYRREQGLY